jgi:BirA family biotin operon repressor/biotin-[acetyl-CoA-carboxylase] ligase
VGVGRATDDLHWRVRHVEETGSTNDDLVAAAHRGEPAGAVLVADFQTAGRGRLGRRWEATPGSALLVSVLLRPGTAAAGWPHGATHAVGLAARDACQDVAGVAVELKWPNDLVVGDRKLAGVLAEGVVDGGRLAAVVVGLGLDVSGPLAGAFGAVCLDELAGAAVARDDLLEAFLARLVGYVAQWETDPAALVEGYRRTLATLGRAVRVELPAGEVIIGTAVDLTATGELVVATGGGDRVVDAGDVVHLRTA